VFSGEELVQLRGFPEITRDELIRFFTLTAADRAFVDPGRGRSPRERLGLAVQLCTLAWLGFVPDDVTAAPPAAVGRLADQLHLGAGVLAGYGEREQTRTDHLRLVLQYSEWRLPRSLGNMELEEFLLARAMEHDSPSLLFQLACEHLRTSQVVRPDVVRLIERVAAARTRAERETYDRLAHLLTEQRRAELDSLLVTNDEIGMARLRWLNTGPTEASAVAVKTEVRKLLFLRGLDAAHPGPVHVARGAPPVSGGRGSPLLDGEADPPGTAPPLPDRADGGWPSPPSMCSTRWCSYSTKAVSGRESRAKHKLADQLAERAKRSEDKLAIVELVLPVLADPAIADEEVGGLLRERIGMSRLRAALAEPATTRLPRDHGHLAQLASSYAYLRQFTPQVLEAITFSGGAAAAELLEAVAVLRSLNATGARSVPATAPTGFVPARCRGYLDDATTAGDTTAYRRYWELCVLLCLRDALRSGDVYVPGARRYANPIAYLIPQDAWAGQREEFCRLSGIAAEPATAVTQVETELDAAISELDGVLAGGEGPVRLDEDGDLVIAPLSAEDVPTEAAELRDELTALLPFAPIASVLIELDRRTGFLDSFTHAGGAKPRSPELKRNLIAVLIAQATNLGLARTADACGIAEDTLAWTQEWYVREETLRAANLALIDYHQRLPLTALFGSGTLSSSDGQRFPTRGKSLTARALSRYFADQGLSTYTHITDQHAVYGTKVIVATDREAPYVLDCRPRWS